MTASEIKQARYAQTADVIQEITGSADPLSLHDLTQLTLQHNPRLAQVGWVVERARGNALQAGLYPNPTLNVTGNELNDRTARGGIWSAPYVTQEFVTADKVGLSQRAANKEVDVATLAVVAERYRVLTEVRQAYFEVLALERRADTLAALVALAEQAVQATEKLVKGKQAAPLDVVQLQVDRDKYRADLDSTRQSLPAAYVRLAAAMGVPDVPSGRVAGDLDTPLPKYELQQVREYIIGVHPEVRSAEMNVERARVLVRRAEVEPIPNVTLGAGYTWQGQNRSNDWDIGLSVPIPVWNRNQGQIRAAKAQLGESISQVARVQNDLSQRLATSFAAYIASRTRVERFKSTIIPKARETYELSFKAYQGGQFEYLRVLAAQRVVAEVNLELIRAQSEMWRAAAEIAGLLLEDEWPLPPNGS